MHTRKRAFTLIELMTVIAVLALLLAMLVPSMSAALEQSRIASCASVLHHIANAMEQYVAENNNHFPVADYRGMIGHYLGLDYAVYNNNGIIERSSGQTIPWENLKPFQCPSGAGLGLGARPDGVAIQNYWLMNGYVTGVWNGFNYYPDLQIPRAFDTTHEENNAYCGGTSHIGLMCELWESDNNMNINTDPGNAASLVYQAPSSKLAQPYSTHYRYGSMGAMGIGRHILYADWHIIFRRCTYYASTDKTESTTTWDWSDNDHTKYVQRTTVQINRGNEVGQSFTIGGTVTPDGVTKIITNPDGTTKTQTEEVLGGGVTYWGWRPILEDPDIAYWWGPS